MHFVAGKVLLFTFQIIYRQRHSLGAWSDLKALLIGCAATTLAVFTRPPSPVVSATQSDTSGASWPVNAGASSSAPLPFLLGICFYTTA